MPELDSTPRHLKALHGVGLHPDISNEEYHGGPGISKSGLDKMARSPAHYAWDKMNPTPPTPAMEFGTALHTLVLEPERFATDYVCGIDAGRRSKADKEAWAVFEAEHPNQVVLKIEDYDLLLAMAAAVATHEYASILLDPDSGPVESSAYWYDDETDMQCRCRPDKINEAHGFVVDLKSTTDASYSGFAGSVSSFRYHVQAAYYTDGLVAVGVPVKRFYFVAVEKTPPYGVGIYQLDKEELEFGRMEYARNLALYAECHATGSWPCYDPEPRILQIPRWGLRSRVS